jgi:hypothetical protein
VPARAHRIELTDAESVTDRGTLRVSWLVRHNDGWVRAADYPGATQERLQAGPGTVWESRIELELAEGTLLARVESRPGARTRKDPLEYLRRETRAPARDVQRLLYRVGASGALRRESRARKA